MAGVDADTRLLGDTTGATCFAGALTGAGVEVDGGLLGDTAEAAGFVGVLTVFDLGGILGKDTCLIPATCVSMTSQWVSNNQYFGSSKHI